MISEFLTLQNQLKIYHWQTKSYAQHQAFGDAYDKLTDFIDEFVEVFMGKYGRISVDDMNIKLKDISELKFNEFIDSMINYLSNELNKNIKDDTDLLNIRDEMLSTLNKLKYLLTLK